MPIRATPVTLAIPVRVRQTLAIRVIHVQERILATLAIPVRVRRTLAIRVQARTPATPVRVKTPVIPAIRVESRVTSVKRKTRSHRFTFCGCVKAVRAPNPFIPI